MSEAKRVLVAGAGGQVGRELMGLSAPADIEMTGLYRAALDICHADAVHAAFDQARPDIVVNLGQTADVGNLRLTSGATVRGTVLGPNGSPLPGATVQLRSDGEEAHSYTARTDVNGGSRPFSVTTNFVASLR